MSKPGRHYVLGRRVRDAREKAGLSLEGMASKVGTLMQTVRAIEDGHLKPDESMLTKIAEATNTPLWLLRFRTPAEIAEYSGYPPSLVDALSTTNGIFVCHLRDRRRIPFGYAQLVGDGSLWIRLCGVPAEEIGPAVEARDNEVAIDVRLDEITWCCNITPEAC